MKKIALATVMTVALSGMATAGSYSDPVVEPQVSIEVVEQSTSSSSNHDWVGWMMLALVIAAASN